MPTKTPPKDAAGAITRARERQGLDGWLKPQTATTAAKALGIDPKTMVKLLREAGHEIGQNKTYSLQDVVSASMGDLEREKIRETRARADLLELERQTKQQELVPMELVQEMMNSTILPVRQRFNALPSEMASRVNPTDPRHAREQLEQWVDLALARITEQLPKAEKAKTVKKKAHGKRGKTGSGKAST